MRAWVSLVQTIGFLVSGISRPSISRCNQMGFLSFVDTKCALIMKTTLMLFRERKNGVEIQVLVEKQILSKMWRIGAMIYDRIA